MNDILLLLMSMSVSGSLIAAFLFLLKPLYKNRLSKTWQFYVWIIVLIRLVVWVNPEASLMNSLGLWAEPAPVAENTTLLQMNREEYNTDLNRRITYNPLDNRNTGIVQEDVIDGEVQEEVNLATKLPQDMFRSHGMFLLWVVVAIGLLVVRVVEYYRFVGVMRNTSNRFFDSHLEALKIEVCRRMGISKAPEVYANQYIDTPMAIGIIQPFIVVPDWNIDEQKFKYILLHEFTHYKRRDIIYKWIAQLILCIHWFNPVVYLVCREIDRGCELSCDEMVMKELTGDEKYSYGETLLAVIKRDKKEKKGVLSLSLNGDPILIKERLSAILKFQGISKIKTLTAMILTGVLMTGAVFAGVYTSEAAEINPSNGISATGRETKEVLEQTNNIEITAKGGNIVVATWPQNVSEIRYNPELYEIKNETKGDTTLYRVGVKEGAQMGFWDKVYIYLPDTDYGMITVQNENAGIEFQGVNANYQIAAAKGSIGISLPQKYHKELNLRLEQSAGSIWLYKEAADYTLNIKNQASAVSLPEFMPAIRAGEAYEYTTGNRLAKIHIESIRSTLTVTEQDLVKNKVDREEPYTQYAAFGLTAHQEGNRQILYHNNERVRIFIDLRDDNSFETCYMETMGVLDIKAVRDEMGNITGISPMRADEVAPLLNSIDKITPDLPDTKNMTGALFNETDVPAAYTEPERLSIAQAPDELLPWLQDCDTRAGIYAAEAGGRIYVYISQVPNQVGWSPSIGETTHLSVRNLSGTAARDNQFEGYALFSFPLCGALHVDYNEFQEIFEFGKNDINLPVDIGAVTGDDAIVLGIVHLNEGDKLSINVSAQGHGSLNVGFVLPEDDPATANLRFYNVNSDSINGAASINYHTEIREDIAGTYKLYIRSRNQQELTNIQGTIQILR